MWSKLSSNIARSNIVSKAVIGRHGSAALSSSVQQQSGICSNFLATCANTTHQPTTVRTFATLEESGLGMQSSTAGDAAAMSGYAKIDFSISEDAMVIEAVQKFAAFNIGCLVTTNEAGDLTGVISERDYITKIALLGRTSKDTKIKEISTASSKLITVKPDDPVQTCMEKMLASDIRHLPLVKDDGTLIGMISIKDLVKATIKESEQTIKVLSDFALGKGGHFGSD